MTQSQRKRDLKLPDFPQNLDWSSANASNSVDSLFTFVWNVCEAAIAWYYASKRGKKLVGYPLRAAAIICVAISGMIPLLGELFKNEVGRPWISPAWATVALALAATLISFDKFWGYTSGWVRYVRSAQALNQLQSDFRLEFETLRLKLQRSPGDATQITECIEACRSFLAKVNSVVRTETDQWAQEFKGFLEDLDKQVKKPGVDAGAGSDS